MRSHKAQGLPISTVILAALGLVVLIVLFGILTGKIQIFGEAVSKCPGRCTTEQVCLYWGGLNLGSNYRDETKKPNCGGSDNGNIICCSKKSASTI